jgi:hypothetical protein
MCSWKALNNVSSIKYKRILKLSSSWIRERKLNFVWENTEFQMNIDYSVIRAGTDYNHKLK